MNQSLAESNCATSWRIKKENDDNRKNDSLVNCDNKTNHCNRYLSDALLSGQNRGKLSIDDESSHPINGSSTNNKSERKRNINMLKDGETTRVGVGMESDVRDNTKRMKLDGIADGQDDNKSKMYQIYQPWVLSTYGDLSKSKTITLKKQSRIVSALKGLETNRPDSSKFRFWVKSKGFMVELPLAFQHVKQNQIENDGCLLFIPSKSDLNNSSGFKRVAVVEYFFNIIYKVHCSVEGEGRHVGQKRTYRKITECYAFLPREAVTKFLTQCNECRRSMKSTIIQEISEPEQNDDKEEKIPLTSSNQQLLISSDYPKNIENYFVILKALYENSSLLKSIKDIQEQSCEGKLESFKENIVANRVDNNGYSNQQNISRKNININIKNESDDTIQDKTVGGERSLGNIIINSLDVSINVAGKATSNSHYGNINKLRISCSTTPEKVVPLPLNSPDQLVTSSSSEPGDDENNFNQISTVENKNILASQPINKGLASAVYSKLGVETKAVPDDTSFDYHDVKVSDIDDRHTTSTTCNNNSKKYPNGEDDSGDYHHRTKSIASIDTGKYNKHNNSTGDIKPITSTYLLMTRSMGLTDEDALNLVSGLYSSSS